MAYDIIRQPEGPATRDDRELSKEAAGRGFLLRSLERLVDGSIFCLQQSGPLAAAVYVAAAQWSRALRAVGVLVLALGSMIGAMALVLGHF